MPSADLLSEPFHKCCRLLQDGGSIRLLTIALYNDRARHRWELLRQPFSCLPCRLITGSEKVQQHWRRAKHWVCCNAREEALECTPTPLDKVIVEAPGELHVVVG